MKDKNSCGMKSAKKPAKKSAKKPFKPFGPKKK